MEKKLETEMKTAIAGVAIVGQWKKVQATALFRV